MRAVLGIDAAWSSRHPSAVALVSEDMDRWSCLALAPSYQEFSSLVSRGKVDWGGRHRGSSPEPVDLLRAADGKLNGRLVTVVALDIPLATTRITGRRQADNLISSDFGGKGCSAHSPRGSELRQVSKKLRDGFVEAGFPLATASTSTGTESRLIEVFPHPALLALLHETYRVPYKVGKAAKYWPECSVLERKKKLLGKFRRILTALQNEIRDIPMNLPMNADSVHRAELKAYEDSLDALVCAWVGIKFLKGEARVYGDDTAAIWVPTQAAPDKR